MNVALVGATGVVGRQILEQFTERSFPVGELRLFASEASVGEFVDFAGDSLPLRPLSEESFAGIDLVILAAPAAICPGLAAQAERAGACCVDLSSAARLDDARPLLVAGVNDQGFGGALCSAPDSLTVELALLLGALQTAGRPASILAHLLVPASDAGRAGIDDLQKQTGELLNGRPLPSGVFSAQLAFNCLPRIETGVVAELERILPLEGCELRVNRLLMPAFFGSGGFVRVIFDEPVAPGAVEDALGSQALIELESSSELLSPLETVGAERLAVQCCSRPTDAGREYDFWFVADNIGLGAAGNALRLAERMVARGA